VDAATDVLSFSLADPEALCNPVAAVFLGEIYISLDHGEVAGQGRAGTFSARGGASHDPWTPVCWGTPSHRSARSGCLRWTAIDAGAVLEDCEALGACMAAGRHRFFGARGECNAPGAVLRNCLTSRAVPAKAPYAFLPRVQRHGVGFRPTTYGLHHHLLLFD